MASDEDADAKTHDPTPRKLQKLREQSNVPTSKEVNNLFALGGMLLLIGLAAPYSLNKLGLVFQQALANAGQTDLDGANAIGAAMSAGAKNLLMVVIPLLLLMLAIGYVGGVVQNGFMWSFESIMPKLSKISPLAGFGRIFSLRGLGELVKAVLKFAVVGAAMGWVMWHFTYMFPTLPDTDLPGSLATVHRLMLYVIGAAIAVMLILAGADYLYQRMIWLRQHRMSMKELKDELRESEGDPHIRQQQRKIRMQRMRKRMMAAVPTADVIITNPTHYSIALRYKPDEGDDAPVVVAKGIDEVAFRIREVAQENNIPLYEDPPLARSLYAQVELDAPIPLDLYEAVARVITFVMQLRARRMA